MKNIKSMAMMENSTNAAPRSFASSGFRVTDYLSPWLVPAHRGHLGHLKRAKELVRVILWLRCRRACGRIGRGICARVAAKAETGNVVLLDLPLLGASGNTYDVAGTIVVDCPIEIAIDRLVNSRGMDADDAARRIAAQITREERVKLADFV